MSKGRIRFQQQEQGTVKCTSLKDGEVFTGGLRSVAPVAELRNGKLLAKSNLAFPNGSAQFDRIGSPRMHPTLIGEHDLIARS